MSEIFFEGWFMCVYEKVWVYACMCGSQRSIPSTALHLNFCLLLNLGLTNLTRLASELQESAHLHLLRARITVVCHYN